MALAHCIHDIGVSYGLPVSMFLAGLTGGFTHCMAMCGVFVMSQSEKGALVQKISSRLVLPYHMGRITTYIFLAVILHALASLLFFFTGYKALIAVPALVIAGIAFLAMAFPRLLMVFPWIVHLRLPFPAGILSRLMKAVSLKDSGFSGYQLGLLLGFIPCGLIVSVLMAIGAIAPTAWDAAIAMGAFGIGTIPALSLVSLGGQAVHKKYPQAMKYMSQTAMALSGVWLFTIAGSLLF